MTVAANHFWLLFLSIVAAQVWAIAPVSTELELHHYDAGSVELLNKGGADGSADIDTNLMLIKALADAPVVREIPIARTDWMMEQGLPVCSLNREKNGLDRQNTCSRCRLIFILVTSCINITQQSRCRRHC